MKEQQRADQADREQGPAGPEQVRSRRGGEAANFDLIRFRCLIEQYALANKPVLLAATGGGDHHALVLEHAMRPSSPSSRR